MRALVVAAAGLFALLALAACGDGEADRTAVGTLERDRIELIAEAQEPIIEIPVREGQSVREGDLLVRHDGGRLAAQVAGAESARDRAAARLAELVRGPREERIREARARLSGVESLLATAERDLERARKLVEQGVLAPDRLDREQARRDDALASRDAAKAVLQEFERGTTEEELQQARAALSEAEASLADLRIRRERLAVRAPRAGQIDALPYEVGERPPQGAVVVVMLADSAPYARVYVPEPLRVRIRPGLEVTVRVDGVDEPLAGRVRSVSHDAVFTPYYALTERDRSRLAYLAEVDLVDPQARDLPTGIPVEVVLGAGAAIAVSEAAGDE
jgi:HlyD family secretion protein